MADYVIDISILNGIGDAIRAKKGTSDPIPVPSLASEILSIEGDGGTYLGTTWRFRENTTADEIREFVSEHGAWDGYFGGYIFETPFTTNPILESDDGEGTITEFTNVHLSYDGGEAYIQMTGNGGFVDIAYLDPDYGGSWRNDFTLTLTEEPSASDLAFLRAFCDQEPEYNGVIPLGNYIFHANPDATVTCEIIEDEEGNPYPYWFETIDETDEVRQGFGIYITPDMTEIEASEEDYMNFYPCDNSPFKVFKEIEVTEEQRNAFMQYFAPQ